MHRINIGTTKSGLASLLLVCVLPGFFLAGCGKKAADTNGPKELKLGYAMAPQGAAHEAARKFAELVGQKTDGTIAVKLFTSAALGTEREMAEGLTFGSVDLVLGGMAAVSEWIPQYEVLEAPYAFRDYDHLKNVLEGEIGREVSDALSSRKRIRVLAWWPRGPRYLTANKEIRTPADLEGMKLRVPRLPTYIEAWKILGANPTPITFSEMFMALKQGLVEGQENPLEIIHTNSLHEVQKYVIETKHLISAYMLLVSEAMFAKLTEQQRTAIEEAAVEAGKHEYALMLKYEDNYVVELKKKGMTFVPVDPDVFRRAVVEKLPERFRDKWAPGIFQRIQDVE